MAIPILIPVEPADVSARLASELGSQPTSQLASQPALPPDEISSKNFYAIICWIHAFLVTYFNWAFMILPSIIGNPNVPADQFSTSTIFLIFTIVPLAGSSIILIFSRMRTLTGRYMLFCSFTLLGLALLVNQVKELYWFTFNYLSVTPIDQLNAWKFLPAYIFSAGILLLYSYLLVVIRKII